MLKSPLTTSIRSFKSPVFYRSFTSSNIQRKMVAEIKTLEQVKTELKYEGLVVLDFFATWCRPCKMIAPILEKLATEYSNAHFFKIDVDESPDVSQEYEVSAMPTVLYFKNGVKIGSVVGANVPQIKSLVEANA
jgi:thioredoxin 1